MVAAGGLLDDFLSNGCEAKGAGGTWRGTCAKDRGPVFSYRTGGQACLPNPVWPVRSSRQLRPTIAGGHLMIGSRPLVCATVSALRQTPQLQDGRHREGYHCWRRASGFFGCAVCRKQRPCCGDLRASKWSVESRRSRVCLLISPTPIRHLCLSISFQFWPSSQHHCAGSYPQAL